MAARHAGGCWLGRYPCEPIFSRGEVYPKRKVPRLVLDLRVVVLFGRGFETLDEVMVAAKGLVNTLIEIFQVNI